MTMRWAIALCLLAVSGCTTTSLVGSAGTTGGSQQGTGTPPSGPVISAMGGGLVSGVIGRGLTDRERRLGLEAEYKALEYMASGQPVTWKSDQSSRYGEVVAAQPYRVGSQDCRQYTHTVYAGGPAATAKGTACRNPDGSWSPLT